MLSTYDAIIYEKRSVELKNVYNGGDVDKQ